MKKFIIKVVCFAGILLIINAFLYGLGNHLYWKPYLKEIDPACHTFLLSDSHGEILGDLTEKHDIFNFSAGSESYSDMYRKVKFLIKNTSVKTIVISVDDHTLSSYRDKLNNGDRSVLYSDCGDFSSFSDFIKQKYIKHYIVLFNPTVRSIVRRYLLYEVIGLVKGRKGDTATNWGCLSDFERKRRSNVRALMQFPDGGESEQNRAILECIVEKCRENDVDLIGIKFPLSKDYVESISGKSFNADRVFLRHSLRVMDFMTIYTNNNSYFRNQDHLNDLGALHFAEVLGNSI